MLWMAAQGRLLLTGLMIGGSFFSGCNSPAVNPGPTQTPPAQGPAFPSEMSAVPDMPADSALELGAAPEAATYHEVKPGDTLNGIARKYGTTAEALIQVNGLGDPNRLQPGQMIYIPK